MATTERDVVEIFMTVLDDDEIKKMSTFEDVGMLTTNKGVVLTMLDGAEFQVTVVKSRWADNETDHDEA